MKKEGSITVFLTLIFAVLSSFVIALVFLVRVYISRSEADLASDCAVRSCFAEYNKELFDRFHILLVDSSYKGYDGGNDRVLEHFRNYLENSLSSDSVIDTRIVSYSDAENDDHEYLYDCAMRYARSEIGEDADFTDYLFDVLTDEEIEQIYSEEGYDGESDIKDAIRDMDTADLLEGFAGFVTGYLRENDSPGFDLENCYHRIGFEAELQGAGGNRFIITRDYEYDIREDR